MADNSRLLRVIKTAHDPVLQSLEWRALVDGRRSLGGRCVFTADS